MYEEIINRTQIIKKCSFVALKGIFKTFHFSMGEIIAIFSGVLYNILKESQR